MSAYMVDRALIASIVRTAVEGPTGVTVQPGAWHGLSVYTRPLTELREIHWTEHDRWRLDVRHETFGWVCEMLRAENVNSLDARYPDGGMVPEWARELNEWNTREGRRLSVGEALGALDCYSYQACEHDEWITSTALRFVEVFRSALVGHVPGYTWNIDLKAAS